VVRNITHSLPRTALTAALAAGLAAAAFHSSVLAAGAFEVGEGDYALQSVTHPDYKLSIGPELKFPIIPRTVVGQDQIFSYDPVGGNVMLSLNGTVSCFDLNPPSATQWTGARLKARDVNNHVVIDAPLANAFSYLPYLTDPGDANLVTVLPVSTGCFGMDTSGSEDVFTLMGVSGPSGEMSLFSDRFQPKGGLKVTFHDSDGGPFQQVARRGEPGNLTDFNYRIRVENTGTLHLDHAGFQQLEMTNSDFHDAVFLDGYGSVVCHATSNSPPGTSCGDLTGGGGSPLRGEGFTLPPGGAVEITVFRRIDPESLLGARIKLHAGVISGENYERDPVFGVASEEVLIADDLTWISVFDPEGDLDEPVTVSDNLGEGHAVRIRALDSELDDTVCPTSIDDCSVPLQGVAIAVQAVCQLDPGGGCDPLASNLYSHTTGDVLTDEDGIAMFEVASKRAGEIRVAFEVTDTELRGLTDSGTLAAEGLVTTADLIFTADEVQRLGFFQQPGDAQVSGEPFATSILLTDQFDNPATVAEGTQVRLNLGREFEVPDATGDPVLGGTTLKTATGSVVAFDDLTVDLAASGYFLKGKVVGQDQISDDSTLFTVAPNVPAIIQVVAGDNQSATVNTAVATPPLVKVTDLNANPVGSGEIVRFEITGGDGSLDNETDGVVQVDVLTDGQSRAQVDVWRLGRTAGPNQLTVTLPGIESVDAPFAATGLPGSPAQLAVGQSPPESALVNTVVEPSPAVIVQDQYSNPLAGKTVRFRPLQDSGFVVEDVVVSDDNGHAAVVGWTLGPDVGIQQLEAELIGSSVDSRIFAVEAVSGPPTAISIDPPSLETVAGECGTVTVAVSDGDGNPSIGVTVTAAFDDPVEADPVTACPSSADTDSSGQAVLQLGARSAGTWDVVFSFGDEAVLEPGYATIVPAAIAAIEFLIDLEPGLSLPVGSTMPETVLSLIDEFGNVVDVDDELTELLVMDGDDVVGDYSNHGDLPSFVGGLAELDELEVLDAVGEGRQLRAAYEYDDEDESSVTRRVRSESFNIILGADDQAEQP
jgi:hypothetical protein